MKNRLSNIELLRIICAFSVLVYHVVNTSFNMYDYNVPFRFFITTNFYYLGRVAVNVFVFISAFFW